MYKILDKVITKDDAESLENELEILLNSLYEEKKDFETTLESDVRYWVSELIKEELGSGEINPETYIKKLKGELESFKTLKIGLAFEPSLKGIEKFSDWVKKNVGKKVLLDLYQKQIVGGAIVEFDGEYRDYSLKKKLNGDYDQIIKKITEESTKK
jgi:hypothetical protein